MAINSTVSGRRYSLRNEQHAELRKMSRRLYKQGRITGSHQQLTPDRAASELLRRIVDYGLANIAEVVSNGDGLKKGKR